MPTTPESGGTAAGPARHEMERAKSEAAHIASDAAEAAKERGREQLDSLRRRTADRADEIADAIESTAQDLESGGGEALSGYERSMAAMMRRFAGGLREQDIEDFASELAVFARRNPGSFLAGSVALGFGVSRFLKATSRRPPEHYYGSERFAEEDEDFDEEYWSDEDELDTTLQPSASPEVSPYAAGQTWPEDRGNERPGAASPTEHGAPAVSEPPSGSAAPENRTGASREIPERDAERRDTSAEPGRLEP
jgi:vacuolar-type H+-ATPase subunit H